MMTCVPIKPLAGVNELILGRKLTVKLFRLLAFIFEAVTSIFPVVAPEGTLARICVSESTLKEAAATPLKVTCVTPKKLDPVIVTDVPMKPLVGVKEVMVGPTDGDTLKSAGLTPVPMDEVASIFPEVAPKGTSARICVLESMVKFAARTPLKLTSTTSAKLCPLMVTCVPTGPCVGVKELITGCEVALKSMALVPVPPGVVTRILPGVAPAGTLARICVLESTVKDVAAILLNETCVVPVKLAPVIVTCAPIGPAAGAKELTLGGKRTVKSLALVAVPPGAVTRILPVVAPAGTVTRICVLKSIVNVVAAMLLNVICVVLRKLFPMMVTCVPAGPEVGAKELMLGGKRTVKSFALMAVPSGTVTRILPVVAPTGTLARICVLESIVKVVAATLLNETCDALAKLFPVMVTCAPTRPEVGENELILGGKVTMKSSALVTSPPGAVALIFPVVAPAGTLARICVLESTIKDAPATLLNVTCVVPKKLFPVMVTWVPAGPLVGVKEEMVGGSGSVTVKSSALATSPPGAVTLILPVLALTDTVARICVSESTLNAAAILLNVTCVAPVKLFPVIVTDVPIGPLFGVKEAMVGGCGIVTVKSLALVAVPSAAVTLIFPVVAPAGTLARISVLETTLKVVAATPLKLTSVAPVKLFPMMVTCVPTKPLVGVNELMLGGKVTVKLLELVAVPSIAVTWILPVVAPAGTLARICVLESTMKLIAATLLNVTCVAVEKFSPLIVICVPIGPLAGVKELMLGGKVTVKSFVLVAVPSGPVTLIFPVVAPVGTVARICVLESMLNAAAILLNFTCVAPVKLFPVMVTSVSCGPFVGLKDEIIGKSSSTLLMTTKLSGTTPVVSLK